MPRINLLPWREAQRKERKLAFLVALGVDVRDVDETRAEWPALLRTVGPDVMISFDCDCCQPEVAPGTMTPVANGFERAEVLRLVRELGEARRVLALDVVELHPDLDREDRTARLASDVILTVAGTQQVRPSRFVPAPFVEGSAAVPAALLG